MLNQKFKTYSSLTDVLQSTRVYKYIRFLNATTQKCLTSKDINRLFSVSDIFNVLKDKQNITPIFNLFYLYIQTLHYQLSKAK